MEYHCLIAPHQFFASCLVVASDRGQKIAVRRMLWRPVRLSHYVCQVFVTQRCVRLRLTHSFEKLLLALSTHALFVQVPTCNHNDFVFSALVLISKISVRFTPSRYCYSQSHSKQALTREKRTDFPPLEIPPRSISGVRQASVADYGIIWRTHSVYFQFKYSYTGAYVVEGTVFSSKLQLK